MILVLLATPLIIRALAQPPQPGNAAPALQQCASISRPEQLDYPVDTNHYRIVNPFGRPNVRYGGRIHVGDDWSRTDGLAQGEPVRAFAPGRVTYADPTGWGRDKGVVILEHRFASGGTFYSVYGHIDETEAIDFPARGTCVDTGDVIGVIGDPRPAPHLHFEIRDFDPLEPGPGYWDIEPTVEGWFPPREFITNWRSWLHPAYRWHYEFATLARATVLPFMRDDGAVILVDDHFLEAYAGDGELVWQYRMADSVDPVGMMPLDDDVLLMGVADGRVLYWDQYGGLVDQWETGLSAIVQGPYVLPEAILLVDDAATLHIFSHGQSRIATLDSVGPIHQAAMTPQLTAFLTSAGQVYLLDTQGSLIDSFTVDEPAAIAASPDGGVFLYTASSLAYISPDNAREAVFDAVELAGGESAMIVDGANSQIMVWGGDRQQLTAITLTGALAWQTQLALPSHQGLHGVVMNLVDRCTLVLAAENGYVIMLDPRTGHIKGQLRLWGEPGDGLWLGYGVRDGLLYIRIAHQLVAYDLGKTWGCTS
ncbi:MAG: M23 family metallopeptidase [Chloroflexi bacterium]|nr:M23 family metallopeptidase [Chloroflexota bacterium]